jgi:hypothetical protein
MVLIETYDAAMRLARAITVDIYLRNEDKIRAAKRTKVSISNLPESVLEEIENGRALYNRRVSPDLYSMDLFNKSLSKILT